MYSCQRSTQLQAAQDDQIRNPPILNSKGRPRTQRLTGALEGRLQGGGARIQLASQAGRRCGVCWEVGHTRANCPLVPP